MEPEFQYALTKWMEVTVKETCGPPVTERSSIIPGEVCSTYNHADYRKALSTALPESLCDVLMDNVNHPDAQNNWYYSWELLDDHDVGVIMKAGAAAYIREVEETVDE